MPRFQIAVHVRDARNILIVRVRVESSTVLETEDRQKTTEGAQMQIHLCFI